MGPRIRSSALVVVVALGALVAGLLPVPADAQSSATTTVEFSFTGWDALAAGERGIVTVDTQITERGELAEDEPLRVLASLTKDGDPVTDAAVEYEVPGSDTWVTTETDADGRFFYPPADQPPLTLDSDTELLTDSHESRLAFTLPAGDFEIEAQLTATGEGAGDIFRIGGANRVETAALISRWFFEPGQDVVFVARADEYPDALAGGPAVSLSGSPILLVGPNQLPTATATELDRLETDRIVILGGEVAVSAAVETALAQHTTGTVDRLGGPTRYETAAEIATANFDSGVQTVYIATGANWPDALAGGAAAAFEQAPILLVAKDVIPDATEAALQALAPQRIVVLGGTEVVSAAVADALGPLAGSTVERLAGDTRYETSAAISQHTFTPQETSTVFVATGAQFPDGLAGAPAASLFGAPMLLVTPTSIPDAAADELARLRGEDGLNIVLLGGPDALSEGVEQALSAYTGTFEPRADDATPLGEPGVHQFAIASATDPGPGPGPDPDPDPDPGAVAGTVTVAGEGTPIPDATVALANGEQHVTTTESDGSYTIEDVAAGAYTATAVAEEFAQDSKSIEVEAGETLTVDFELSEIPDQFDTEVTVQLNWQNQYRDAEGVFGGVDDYAAFHLDDDGAGKVTLKWNEDAGMLVTEGETTVTSRIPGNGTLAGTDFHVHAGALDAEGPVALALQAPTFVGNAADEPGEDDRGLYTYSLDGAVVADDALLAQLDAALGQGGRIDWYVNVHTDHNPAGEVRGQLHASDEDNGLSSIVSQFKYFEFHELGTGTITGTEQTSFNLWFDADIEFAGDTGRERPQPDDLVLTINGEEHDILRVRGDNPDWQPYPKQDIRIHLDTQEIVEDGDVVEVTMLEGAVEKLRPVGRNAGAEDLSDSWRTRCTVVLSVDAMTSEPCGTPPQPGLSAFEATPIDSAPHQDQEFSVTIGDPGIPPHPAGHYDDFDGEDWEKYDAEPWEVWLDLDEVSHEGLVDYSDSTWTAEVDGEEVGTVEFWEYREVERFAIEFEPFLVFTHDDAEPVSGELVLKGTGIDGSDAAVHGEATEYDTFVVRYDTGRADYTEIVVNYVPQPLITLEPADAVVLAEDGADIEMTATYTDVDGDPVADAELRFWAETGERPDVEIVKLGTERTNQEGQATITYVFDGREVGLGDPLIDILNAEDVADTFVDAETTVTWATGVATNVDSGATYHDLNDADPDAEAGDTITARGEFTSVYGLPRTDRVQLRTPDLTLQGQDGASLEGAVDVRANGVTVDGFDVEQDGSMEYAFRVEGADITISNNDIDANGADGFRVRDAWGRVEDGGSAVISDNEIRNATIGIDVDNRDQATELVTDLTIEDNLFEDNEVGIHYNPADGTPSIADNHFVAGDAGEVYVRDLTEGEDLDLTVILTGNTYDPPAEVLARSIMPIDPLFEPSMVRVVEHGAGTGNMYSIVEYTRGVACDADGAEVGSQFVLDRGEEQTPNRVGEDVVCNYDGNPSLVRIEWDGNPSFPKEITYTEHDSTYRIHNEHELDGGGFTPAETPQTIGSPFPPPEDEAPVYGSVYLNYGASSIHERWFTQGQEVSPVTLRVAIANRSEVPDTGLSLWFDGARPGEEFTAGEDICDDLLTPESCTLIENALEAGDGFDDNTIFLDEEALQLDDDAALGVWQLRFWVVDADTGQPYFSDTFNVEIISPQATSD